ncbi:MAG: energy-coupling factor transporter ATPase [Clostridiales bacterium]|jgi:energy-coupling factor transport system ATP-binding protein|nr:energy-coupling factor transporter ATPase [Clostridiales bacterium]
MQLQLDGVNYVYSEGTAFEKKALGNINLNIGKGEFVAIIGHTGSGKSTLIQHFNGLIKPTSGKVLFEGADIHENKKLLKTTRQKIGLVFQYPEAQLFEITVFKDVAFGPLNMGLSKEEADVRTRNALEIVGINECDFEKSPFELSGGQKRRAAIAGVLAMNPEILVLDEPTAGLDPRGRDEILFKIKEMRDKLNITIILVSHSMEDVAKLADRVIVMSDGHIVMDGTVKEVFREVGALSKIGLAAPKISYLMKALKEKGFDVPIDIYTPNEAADIIYNLLTRQKSKSGGAK